MIITYMRSSLAGTEDVCEHKVFLDYVLCLPSPAGDKASRGSAIHKAFEVMNLRQLAIQDGQDTVDAEDLGIIPVDKITPYFAIRAGFNEYKRLEQPNWDEKVFDEIKTMFYKALKVNNGAFHPENMNILAAEKRFDIVLDKPWAKYHYELPGKEPITGTWAIRGTIDLVLDVSPTTIEVCDYKSGANRTSLKTGKLKMLEDFEEDFQINLYLYAISKLYPKKQNFIFTIFWIQAGGPFTVCKSRKEIEGFESVIRKRFERIRDNKNPSLRKYDYFCKYVCAHAKNKQSGTNQTVCNFFKDKIAQDGIDQVTADYARMDLLGRYLDGGGRKAKDPNDLGKPQ